MYLFFAQMLLFFSNDFISQIGRDQPKTEDAVAVSVDSEEHANIGKYNAGPQVFNIFRSVVPFLQVTYSV